MPASNESNEAMTAPSHPSTSLDPGNDDREEAARHYVEHLRALYVHASMYAVGMLIMFAINLVINLAAGTASQWTAWWSAWAFAGWGLGIVVHGFVVWLARPVADTHHGPEAP